MQKALLRVIPFNDYSGSYSTSTMEVYIRNANGSTDNKPMVTNNRTAYVVDNNTIFFLCRFNERRFIKR